MNALLDTGSEVTVVNFDVYNKLIPKPCLKEKVRLNGICREVDVDAWLLEGIEITFGQTKNFWNVYVAQIAEPLIIGIDFLCHFGAKLDFRNYIFTLNDEKKGIHLFKTESGDSFEVCPVTIDKKTVIPPNSVVRTLVKSSLLNETYAIHSVNSQGLLIPNTVVTGGGTHVPVQLVNDQNRYVRLKKGHVIGHAIQCDVVLEVTDTDSSFKVRSITDKPLSQQVDELPEHLSGLFSRSVNNLDSSEQKQLKTLLLEFQHIFSKGSGDLGCFSEIKHKINTGDERPVKQPMRRTPIGFEKEEEDNLKLMLETGVISESSSDWASAPVLVRKKDGSVRYCVDFRCLNDKTVKDLFPLPSLSQCLDQLSGNMYFSTLDMASGYWQIEIDEQDRHKTAFITKFGLFEH